MTKRELFRQLCEAYCEEWDVKLDEIDADFVIICPNKHRKSTFTTHFGKKFE